MSRLVQISSHSCRAPLTIIILHRDSLPTAAAHVRDILQVAGMSESEVLKMLDSPVRFSGSQ